MFAFSHVHNDYDFLWLAESALWCGLLLLSKHLQSAYPFPTFFFRLHFKINLYTCLLYWMTLRWPQWLVGYRHFLIVSWCLFSVPEAHQVPLLFAGQWVEDERVGALQDQPDGLHQLYPMCLRRPPWTEWDTQRIYRLVVSRVASWLRCMADI